MPVSAADPSFDPSAGPSRDWADLVQQRAVNATRQDLVLPRDLLRALDRMALQCCAQKQEKQQPAGRCVSALFTGPRGTGKTLTAEVLAHEAGLDFRRIGLSRLISRQIGETEKNLARLFAAGAALLLFDEADALFARRGEVAGAQDRFANAAADYLLQRLDDYSGIVILTVDTKNSIDPAFQRQFGFILDFPFPDSVQRAAIWRRIFPPDTPVEGLDPERLARLPLTGADIRDIARSSAMLAAEEGQPVRMAHLLRAAVRQCARLNLPIDLAAIGRP